MDNNPVPSESALNRFLEVQSQEISYKEKELKLRLEEVEARKTKGLDFAKEKGLIHDIRDPLIPKGEPFLTISINVN